MIRTLLSINGIFNQYRLAGKPNEQWLNSMILNNYLCYFEKLKTVP